MRWLLSEEGQERLAHVTAARDAGEGLLLIGTRLRRQGLDARRANLILDASRARRRARADHALADELVFTARALEQASHPLVASHRARRYAGAERVIDLCCGAGVDALALGDVAREVVAVDRDESHVRLTAHNATVARVTVRAAVADVLRPALRLACPVHIDPARRAGGQRARTLADYQPPVAALVPVLGGTPAAGIVLSPAVSLHDPDLPTGEVEFVQVGDALTEAVVWLGDVRRDGALATATILADDGTTATRSRWAHPSELAVRPIGSYLVEVAPAAVRARLHDEIGRELGAWRLARRRALLSVDRPPAPSVWWRTWAIEAVLPCRPRALRTWLGDADELPVEFATHGLDLDLEAFWRASGRPQRGPRGRRVHLVRSDDGAAAYVCRVA